MLSTNANDEAQEVLHALFSSESSSDEAEDEEPEQQENAPPPIPDQETAPNTLPQIQMMLTELVKTHRASLLAALQSPVQTHAKTEGDGYIAQARAAILFKSVSLHSCTGKCVCDPECLKDLKTLSWERYNQNTYNREIYKSTDTGETHKIASTTITDPGSRRMWRDLFILSSLISAFQQLRGITTTGDKHHSTSLDSIARRLLTICNDCDVAFIVGAPIELVHFLVALAERVASEKGVQLVDLMTGPSKSKSLDAASYTIPSVLPPDACLPKYANVAPIRTLRIAPSSAVFGRVHLQTRTPVIIRNATAGWFEPRMTFLRSPWVDTKEHERACVLVNIKAHERVGYVDVGSWHSLIGRSM